MPQSGFQALVLCGPGIGLSTFTSIPDEYPKALVSIANRPMVWYVLDWCYRMGVTSKQTLVIFESLFKIS
jgi:translation initiation factor eIF-2B subunit gamma